MTPFFIGLLTCFSAFFRSRYNLSLEILARRQQLGVLKRKQPRPRPLIQDRLFWILLRRLWPAWSNALVIVQPDTVVAWHRAGFRLFWHLRSRPRSLGRPKIEAEVRALIHRMVDENSTWGAPRIHGELLKLGFDVSERTVSRYLRRLYPRDQARILWATFLRNHREFITATDFLTVPTLTFRVLYCFFVIEHARRKILHFNVTEHPTGPWIVQQLRAAFPESCPYRYAILDRDGKFGVEVTDFLTASGLKPARISPANPWQNGIAERWIGSCRRDLLDHVLIFNEAHLRRLVKDYVFYYHTDRTHDGLEQDTPVKRPVVPRPAASAQLLSFPRMGGLHHRYDWQRAA
jgi:transposase InsO family protein